MRTERVIGVGQVWKDKTGRNWYVQGASFGFVTATTSAGLKVMAYEDSFRKLCRFVRQVLI